MTKDDFTNIVNARVGVLIGVPGAREIYNTLWDSLRFDPDFDAAVEEAENFIDIGD